MSIGVQSGSSERNDRAFNKATALVLVVVLDAFRHDYISASCSGTRNLWNAGLSGSLIPSFGFEPDAAFLAGLHPDECDGGAQFWYDPRARPFRFVRCFPALVNNLPVLLEKMLRRALVELAKRRCRSPLLSTARIPFGLLRHFGPSARVGLDQPGFCAVKTVFDLLRASGKRWLYHGVPARGLSMDFALRRAQADLRPPVEFAYFHVANLDGVGHKFGPDSYQRYSEMRRLETELCQLNRIATNRFEEVHFLVFGDHGMTGVIRHLDVQRVLWALPARLGRDYLMFLDSTMARFWFFTESARTQVLHALDELQGGHRITQHERSLYHLNYRHNRFGDEIFLADPGVLILPNFYQGCEPIRGMHGYAPETPDQQSAFFIRSPRVHRQRRLDTPQDMRRLFPTFLGLLDLPVPAGLDVQSLL